LIQELDEGEFYIADGGYKDANRYGITPTGRHDYSNRQKAVISARHETINGRFKFWGCLRNTWRHKPERHRHAFRAVVNIVQMELERGLQAFQIEYDENDT